MPRFYRLNRTPERHAAVLHRGPGARRVIDDHSPRRADVIAVRGEVLAEIGMLKEVDVAVKGGKRHK